MTSGVARQLEKLERATQTMLSALDNWAPEQLRYRASPNVWSALDVIKHLHQVERGFLYLIRKDSGPATVSIAERVRARVVIGIMNSPMRVKVPGGTPVDALPKGKDSLEEARREWLETRERVRKLLTEQSGHAGRRGLFRHPLSGWMTLETGVAFLAAHCRHHLFQIKRLDKARRVHCRKFINTER